MESLQRDSFNDIVKFALIAFIIVVPIRIFIAQPFIVRGASMDPTFQNGQYLIVDQLSYRFEAPKRGDVIIMRYPKDPSVFFIKRIIGLPGETVEIQGKQVVIQQGVGKSPITLDESFIDPSRIRDEYASYTVGPDEYFVMGDNRKESSDSRSWGLLPRKDIMGKTFLRLFPLSAIALSPGHVSFPQ